MVGYNIYYSYSVYQHYVKGYNIVYVCDMYYNKGLSARMSLLSLGLNKSLRKKKAIIRIKLKTTLNSRKK
jgi:hypothetical protein